jgi:hypothetical protein
MFFFSQSHWELCTITRIEKGSAARIIVCDDMDWGQGKQPADDNGDDSGVYYLMASPAHMHAVVLTIKYCESSRDEYE